MGYILLTKVTRMKMKIQVFFYQNVLCSKKDFMNWTTNVWNVWQKCLKTSTYMGQGSHATWKTWNFVIFISRPGKCLEFAQKVVKTWNFNSKHVKNLKFSNSVSSFTFQDVIYKNNSDLLLCHIYIINTNTGSKPNWPWISLLLPWNNLENTWNFVSQKKWEPCP